MFTHREKASITLTIKTKTMTTETMLESLRGTLISKEEFHHICKSPNHHLHKRVVMLYENSITIYYIKP